MLRSLVASRLRLAIRDYMSIPTGSILWIENGDDLINADDIKRESDLPESLLLQEIVRVHLDTPKGDFEHLFDFNIGVLTSCNTQRKRPTLSKRGQAVKDLGILRVSEAEDFVRSYCQLIMDTMANHIADSSLSPDVFISWGSTRANGSKSGIRISLGDYVVPCFLRFTYNEYAQIQNDPEIGGFRSADSYQHLKAIIAHELAHFLQYNVCKLKRINERLDYSKAHGEGWRYLYRLTRASLNQELSLERECDMKLSA